MLHLRTKSDGTELHTSHDELPQLVAAVEEHGERDGWPDDLTFRVSLVIDELVQNVVDYAYVNNEGDVEVVISGQEETVAIDIIDEGRAFDPLTDAPEPDLKSSVENRRIGGLGVHFTMTLMDKVGYTRELGQNRLRIVTNKVR